MKQIETLKMMSKILPILALIVMAGCATGPSDYGTARTYPEIDLNAPEVLDALHGSMRYRFGDTRAPLVAVEDLVRRSADSPKGRVQLAGMLGDFLGDDGSFEGKQFVCRQLRLIGTKREVDALAALLGDARLNHPARYALEGIPGAEADKALINAAVNTTGEAQIGAIHSLGVRGSSSAEKTLKALAKSGDADVAAAAEWALARL